MVQFAADDGMFHGRRQFSFCALIGNLFICRPGAPIRLPRQPEKPARNLLRHPPVPPSLSVDFSPMAGNVSCWVKNSLRVLAATGVSQVFKTNTTSTFNQL
jgi:hypothetical protein